MRGVTRHTWGKASVGLLVVTQAWGESPGVAQKKLIEHFDKLIALVAVCMPLIELGELFNKFPGRQLGFTFVGHDHVTTIRFVT